MTKVRLEAFFAGNMTADHVKKIAEIIKDKLFTCKKNSSALSKDEIPEVRVVNIPSGTTWIFDYPLERTDTGEVEANSAIVSHF